MPLLTPADERLAFRTPQAVDRGRSAVRLDRFPRQAADVLLGQIGPLANLRSSPGCGVRLATDSPWLELRLERLRHHQWVPQAVGLEVDGAAIPGPDLREREGDIAVRLPTGLERGGTLGVCDLWLPCISTCAIAGVAVADGARVAQSALPEPRWLAIGDSLTQGFSVQSPLDAWVHRCARRWDLPVWNLGVGGIRIEPEAFAWALAARRWDLVTIALGSNHAWRESTVATAADQAAALAELALAGGHGRVLWLLPPWKPCEAGQGPADFAGVPLDADTGRRVGAVREAMRSRLSAYAPRLALVEGLLPADARLLPDGLHPQAQGAAVYAERLIQAARG